MQPVLDYLGNLFSRTLNAVLLSLSHNWLILIFAIVTATVLKTYVNTDKLSKTLLQKTKVSILASVLFGAFTPFCACGTTAVIIGLLTTTLPWGPIMAFLTSSPLMSPNGFIMMSGILGVRFAIALTLSSLVIGIGSGFITNIIEKKTKYLNNQTRYSGKAAVNACSCAAPANNGLYDETTENAHLFSSRNIPVVPSSHNAAPPCTCSCPVAAGPAENYSVPSSERDGLYYMNSTDTMCCSAPGVIPGDAVSSPLEKFKKNLSGFAKRIKLRAFVDGLVNLGLKQILLSYSVFIAVGFLINSLIPSSLVTVLFGADSITAVPLASIIGLPLYVTTESAIPLIQSMLQSGASEGAMLSFIITGSGTSAWVISGLSTFMKKRVIALYVLFILIGGMLSGYLYDLVLLAAR